MQALSYQLYSSRNFPPIGDTVDMLASLGYTEVEGNDLALSDPDALATALTKNNLRMPTAHIALSTLEADAAGTIELAKQLGITHLFAPYLDPNDRPNNRSGWRQLGQRLASLHADYKPRGIVIGWHNHDFEFIACDDGSMPMTELLDAAPEIAWEADLAWIQRADVDPKTWLNQYAGRIPAIHVKDIAPAGECADEDGWADVGTGVMDWPSLFAAARAAKVQHFIMEHDNPTDHVRFATQSFHAARQCLEG